MKVEILIMNFGKEGAESAVFSQTHDWRETPQLGLQFSPTKIDLSIECFDGLIVPLFESKQCGLLQLTVPLSARK